MKPMSNAHTKPGSDQFMQGSGGSGVDNMDDEARTMPLSFEETGESINVVAGGSQRRFGFGTMVFASVGVVAVVSLFSMRAIGHADAADSTQSEAGKLVMDFLKEARPNPNGATAPIDLLDADVYAELRISREELSKDPFIIIGETVVVAPGATVDPSRPAEQLVNTRDAQIEGWNAIVDAGTSELRVQSALVSGRAGTSIANVNGKVLRMGESVISERTGISFEVALIEQNGVTFRATNADLGVERTVMVLVKRFN